MSPLLPALLALAVLPARPKGPPADVEYGGDLVTLETQGGARVVRFEGNVTFRQADLTASSQRAQGELAPEPKAPPDGRKPPPKAALPGMSGQEIRRFTLEGEVRLQRGARTAEAARAVYDAAAGTFTLTGQADRPPLLRDGPETLRGERILLHLESDDVDVARPRLTLWRSEKADQKPQPVSVQANELSLDQTARVARFREQVVVRRSDLTVRGPRMEAAYGEDNAITVLEVQGGVELTQGERRAVARTARYDAVARTLTLQGEPRLYERGDVLAGELIELALDSHLVKVTKARGRLRPERHPEAQR